MSQMRNYVNAMLRAALMALALILGAAPVSADLSEDALVAYSNQDYQTAARLYRELAEQGDVEAQKRIRTSRSLSHGNGPGSSTSPTSPPGHSCGRAG